MGGGPSTDPGAIFSLGPMGKNYDAVFVPMSDDGMTTVTVNFEELIDSASAGDTGYIRFKFDTQDGWGNEWMRGWVVDDIEIQGTQ